MSWHTQFKDIDIKEVIKTLYQTYSQISPKILVSFLQSKSEISLDQFVQHHFFMPEKPKDFPKSFTYQTNTQGDWLLGSLYLDEQILKNHQHFQSLINNFQLLSDDL